MSPGIVKPIAELFRGDRVALWATTYNMDLAFFAEYLLGRLGDPPLNCVVLCDQERLDSSLEAVPPERLNVLGSVNRDWLLRGVRLGSGRFHPKSYLSVTPRAARLFVGSGNLSTSGVDAGREVFTSFSSGTSRGDAAIRTWRVWVRQLIDEVDDPLLAERFIDLERRLPSTTTPMPVVDSPLWHNLHRPLADQLCEAILARASTVDELIVTAPFYDEAGEALGRLVDRLAPKRVRLYVSRSTNVDGARLLARLEASEAQVEALSYLPDRFTHAKLIGVVAGGHGWMLSGSANLSHAALTLEAGPGNVELGVFAELPAGDIHLAFMPPEVDTEERLLESLADLSFDSNGDEGEQRPVRLVGAAQLDDGRISLNADTVIEDEWRLADQCASVQLLADGSRATTAQKLNGPLVHLVDGDGSAISNRVVFDDLVALDRVLQKVDRHDGGRPAELTAADLDSPLGHALLFLHRNVVMDINERAGLGGGSEATRDETRASAEDEDLWERLEREKLGRDPRAGTYDRLLGHRIGPGSAVAEPLVELLEAMSDRVPAAGSSPGLTGAVLQLVRSEHGSGADWSTSARIRVRTRNVLRRWAAAQTDPRLSWVDPLAPVGNLSMVAAVFARLWSTNGNPELPKELTEEDLDELWARWFQPFVGSGQGDGWLDRVGRNDERLAAALEGDLAKNATALCWLSIRPGSDHRARVVEWQPHLRAAFERNLIDVDSTTAEFLASAGYDVSVANIEDDLLRALEFIDDQLWCERTSRALGLGGLVLEASESGQAVSVRVRVASVEHPLQDPRLPSLIVAACRYRSAESVAVFASDNDWRVAFVENEPLAYMADLDASLIESEALDLDVLEQMVRTQGVLASLLPAEIHVA